MRRSNDVALALKAARILDGDITPLQLELLMRLRIAGAYGTSQSSLVDDTGATEASVSRSLKKLREGRLASSRHDLFDKRNRMIVITDSGLRMCKIILGET